MNGLPTLHQDSPNAVTITVGKMEIAFSYTTIVGFYSPDTGWRVSENLWSSTTGKHINALPKGDKARRVPRDQFEAELLKALITEGLAEGEAPKVPGSDQANRTAPRYRYVEVIEKNAGVDARIRAFLPADPISLREAEEQAVADAAAHWRVITEDVEIYRTRTITREKHDMIYAKIVDGTWEMWSHHA